MNNNTLQNKKQIKLIAIITLILLSISFLYIFYDLYAYQEIKNRSLNIDQIVTGIFIGYIPNIFLYVSFSLLILLSLKLMNKFKLLGILSIICGIVSAISLVGDYAALTDIINDYLLAGYKCTIEWATLYFGIFFHLLFFVITFLAILKIFKFLKSPGTVKNSVINEILFEIIQYIGIICGLIGLGFIAFTIIIIPNNQLFEYNWFIWLILIYSLIIFLPYIAILFYWIIKLKINKDQSSYDEKQRNDLTRAGFTSWFLSLPVMLVFFFIDFTTTGYVSSVLWLPFYIFFNLLIFSFATLVYFKKDI